MRRNSSLDQPFGHKPGMSRFLNSYHIQDRTQNRVVGENHNGGSAAGQASAKYYYLDLAGHLGGAPHGS